MTRRVKDNKKALRESRGFISVSEMALLLEPDGEIVKQQRGKGGDAPQIFQIQKKRRQEGLEGIQGLSASACSCQIVPQILLPARSLKTGRFPDC